MVSISTNHILPFAEMVLTMALAISMYNLFPFYRQETESQAVEVNPGSSVNKGSRLISPTPNIVPCTLPGVGGGGRGGRHTLFSEEQEDKEKLLITALPALRAEETGLAKPGHLLRFRQLLPSSPGT